MAPKFVVWFSEVDKEDISLVGGKGANLGEMTKAGFPVPSGFIVTVNAYRTFLSEAKLEGKIRSILSDLDVGNSKQLEDASRSIHKLIVHAPFPVEIARAIIPSYLKLDSGILKNPLVAVRSSATAEDLPGASFAGQQETFLNVHGEATLIEKIKEAWASLFTARAIFYRDTHKFDHFKVAIAVPVQRMVESDASGVMFTIDPVTNDKQTIVIEAIYGLGEMIVQGAVTPDHYEVEKSSLTIKAKGVKTQEKKMVRKGSANAIVSLPKKEATKQKITDGQIIELAKLAKKLERHYFFPQDSEWAIEKGKVYIVQTRPVTTTGNKAISDKQQVISNKDILVKGDPASPGMGSGPVRLLSSPKEIHRIIAGDVLVAEMTNPDYVPAMRKAVAIVTERGGRTSHAAIVSRELGIPAVVGAKNARKTLKDGVVVTVNGSTGEVYRGALSNSPVTHESHVSHGNNIKTATKVLVNIAEPERAQKVASLNVDGVGLFRAEFMMASIGVHPKKIIKDKKQKQYIETLAEQMSVLTKAFTPRPVVYRTSDFRSNEFRNLRGGQEYEPVEPNPMLGFRGAARYIASPEVFEMEMEAIKVVRNKMNVKNLWVMLPFVRNPQELLGVKKLIASCGLSRSPSFKLWMMVEIPTNVIRIDDFLDIGIDGISFGSNDLTMLILGTDRDNSDVARDYNEVDPSLFWSYERVIKACVKRGVTSSMCGQAPSDFPQLVDKLVSWGISSMSVNVDAIDRTRETIAEAEKKLVHKVIT